MGLAGELAKLVWGVYGVAHGGELYLFGWVLGELQQQREGAGGAAGGLAADNRVGLGGQPAQDLGGAFRAAGDLDDLGVPAADVLAELLGGCSRYDERRPGCLHGMPGGFQLGSLPGELSYQVRQDGYGGWFVLVLVATPAAAVHLGLYAMIVIGGCRRAAPQGAGRSVYGILWLDVRFVLW
jgi:hypothetical protein